MAHTTNSGGIVTEAIVTGAIQEVKEGGAGAISVLHLDVLRSTADNTPPITRRKGTPDGNNVQLPCQQNTCPILTAI